MIYLKSSSLITDEYFFTYAVPLSEHVDVPTQVVGRQLGVPKSKRVYNDVSQRQNE